jgi:hypothetical protein
MEPAIGIALGALGVAAMSLYLNYRERIVTLRTTIYAKQLELLRDMSPVFGALCHELPHLFVEVHDARDRQFVECAREKVEEAYYKVETMSLEMFALFPVVVNDFFGDFKAAADDVYLYELQTEPHERDTGKIQELLDELSRASLAYIHAVRNSIGTTQLLGSVAKTGAISRRLAKSMLKREHGRLPRLTLRDPEAALTEFLVKDEERNT